MTKENQKNIWINSEVIWRILQKIKELLIKSKSRTIIYPISNLEDRNEKDVKEEIEGLYELSSGGAIKILMCPSPTLISHKVIKKRNKKEYKKIINGTKSYLIPLEVLRPKFDEVYQYYKDDFGKTTISQPQKNRLKSIHLITHKLIGDRLDIVNTIFLALDGHFEMPIRCAIKNRRGEPTYIKKLYDIAYFVDAPGKKVEYNKRLADNINNGLFKKRRVAKYMKTNKLEKPTLVQKSEDGNYLVLKNEMPVYTGLVKKDVSLQFQSLYIDKTK